eukprot:5599871-Alexandrium_andersonii.AAC.1
MMGASRRTSSIPPEQAASGLITLRAYACHALRQSDTCVRRLAVSRATHRREGKHQGIRMARDI